MSKDTATTVDQAREQPKALPVKRISFKEALLRTMPPGFDKALGDSFSNNSITAGKWGESTLVQIDYLPQMRSHRVSVSQKHGDSTRSRAPIYFHESWCSWEPLT